MKPCSKPIDVAQSLFARFLCCLYHPGHWGGDRKREHVDLSIQGASPLQRIASRFRIWMAAAWVLLLAGAPSSKAQQLVLNDSGVAIATGRIAPRTSIDEYRLTTPSFPGQTTLRITMIPTSPDRELDAKIQIRDSNRSFIAGVDSGSDDQPETLSFTDAIGNTTYFIYCSSADWSLSGSGEYELRIELIPTNDRISGANSLAAVSQTRIITGEITSASDIDLFSFSVEAGQRISFDTDQTSRGLNSYIRLFDSTGNELAANDDNSGPGEVGGLDSYLEYHFHANGTFYLGVSSAGNATYNAITGAGSRNGSTGPYKLVVSPGLAGTARVDGVATDYPVDLLRTDSKAIDPSVRTWIVIHGRNSSRTADNIAAVAAAIAKTRQGEQVLTLDWSGAASYKGWTSFGGEDAIQNVAIWAAWALRGAGFVSTNLNLVGHSWGSYVADELAQRLPGGVNTIAALDAAENVLGGYSPETPGEIDFARNSAFSWAFHSDGLAGSNLTPVTADEAFVVHNSDHSSVVFLFANLLLNPFNAVARFFALANLLFAEPGPWVRDQYISQLGIIEFPVGGYEALIYSAPGGTNAVSLVYVTNAPIVSILEPLPMTVFREPRAFIRGQASDLGRGDSGIRSVVVNGSTAVGGVSVAAQTAFWSNTVALKLGTNTVQVVVTDSSAINPGKATNFVVVKYQPEFIDLPSQVFDELVVASLDLAADDKSLSDRVLSHSLKSGPSGLSVTVSGRLAWVPTEAQGPSTNLVEVAVTDGDVQTAKRIILVVREVNTPPSLAALPDVILAPGVEWSVPAVGTDVDLPAQPLAYALKSAPGGMSIHPSTGIIRWTPSKADGPRVYPVTILVTDSVGAAGEQSFRVTVSGPAQAPILAISSANPDGTISLQISAEQGLLVDLEHSGDLNTWVLAQQITGQTMGQPVQLVLPTDPNTQAVFWRLRLR